MDEIREELGLLTQIIVETVPTESIYLFGSYAYGTPHKDSDIDLYIVLKDDAPMRDIEALWAVDMRLHDKIHKPLDLQASKKSRFLDRQDSISMLEKTVAKEGIKIYG